MDWGVNDTWNIMGTVGCFFWGGGSFPSELPSVWLGGMCEKERKDSRVGENV